MKKRLLFLVWVLIFHSCVSHEKNENEALFLIQEEERYGFIDVNGDEVIKPIYRNAGDFTEGLAPVRKEGTYGYIDKEGEVVIDFQYDSAKGFYEGKAVVYLEGKPFYIDKRGQKLFEHDFMEINPFVNKRALVKTKSKRYGLINPKGELIIDTIYERIGPFEDGVAVVRKKQEGSKDRSAYGLIDTNGNFIVPLGTYYSIDDRENGYFLALNYSEGEEYGVDYVLNKKGEVILSRPQKNNSYIDAVPYNGLMNIGLYKHWVHEAKGSWSSQNSYGGYLDLNGNRVIDDTTYKYTHNFSYNRAIVETHQGNQIIINTKGERIRNDSIYSIEKERFENGINIAICKGKVGIIDTNAQFIVKPKYEEIKEVIGDVFFYSEYQDNDITLYGIQSLDGRSILKPIVENYDGAGFKNGLLRCVVDDALAYVNKSGKMVWKGKGNYWVEQQATNIDYMKIANFYTHFSKEVNKADDEENYAANVKQTDQFPIDSIALVVTPNENHTSLSNYYGVKLINTTQQDVEFNVQDGRLHMKVQALNKNKEWQDIEQLLNSWCGNSYYTESLKPNQYWSFHTPKYEGDFATKFRIVLKYIDPADTTESHFRRKEIEVYSNAYEGSVNPGQFWQKRKYDSSGLMDPYYN